MSNKEYVEFMVLLGNFKNLQKSEVSNLVKSPVSVKKMYDKLYDTMKTYSNFRDMDEKALKYTVEMAKLCKRHKMQDSEFDSFYERFVEIFIEEYEESKIMWDKDFGKCIKYVNAVSPLKINLDDFMVNIGSGIAIADGEMRDLVYGNICDGWPGIGFSKERFFKSIVLKDGKYILGVDYIDIKDFDKLWLPKLDSVRYEVMGDIAKDNLSNKEYFDKLRRFGLIKLSIGINLDKYSKLETCKFNIKNVVREVASLNKITDTEVIKFLIMITELAENQDELDKLAEVLSVIRETLVIHSSIITVLLRYKVDSLDLLVKVLKQTLMVSRILEIKASDRRYVTEHEDGKITVGIYDYSGRKIGKCDDDFEILSDGTVRVSEYWSSTSDDCFIKVYGARSVRGFNGEED